MRAEPLTLWPSVLWLGRVARRKLDGFHARCVRIILRIAPSYYSRVSNADVLKQMRAPTLSSMVLEQQLGYFGKLARRPSSCGVRGIIFQDDLSLKTFSVARRRGRPRLEWGNELFKVVRPWFETHTDYCACISNEKAWRTQTRRFCKAMSSS